MNENVPDKFLKPYDPVATEDRIYDLWEKSRYFNPDNLPQDDSVRFGFKDKDGKNNIFSIVLPPPNVTGVLHMGSAMMLAIEDVMVRYARMKGKRTLWLPGTDHAAIATQTKVEKEIQKTEGKSRCDLGREELLRRVGGFVEENKHAITGQIKKMGCSVDWSREAFTLDKTRSLAVRAAFKKMHDDGLVYRSYRVVKWDTKGQTTISDDEIEYETRKIKLYTFKYSKDIPVSISTTRPETKLGDTAIAVHPDDGRYKEYVGREFDTVFAGEPIHVKVIADTSVDPEFGTGALGVTPAHSIVDWEISEKHRLPLKQVINEYGRMTVGNSDVKDKKIGEAREVVVLWLKEQGLLEKEEEIEHNISLAQRTGGVIEPLPKLQWFVAVNKEFQRDGKKITLKNLMKEAVASGAIKIIPDRFEKIYFHWIENLRDWCVSRQIWYGHRIPVWYKGEETYVGVEAPNGEGWRQDEDTLDTWFSSGLWTFSTLGWPKKTDDLKTYHPTTILETGSDILFFWVARMILMSTYLLYEVPFRTVYLHGLVRDGQGRKISKSLDNNIDPLYMIAKYGADAVRMSLIVGVGPGNDSKVDEQKIKAYKLFANKIWNITRFVLTNTQGLEYEAVFEDYSPADAELIRKREEFLSDVTADMDNLRYYMAGEKLYQYVWHAFADIIVEESKKIIAQGSAEESMSRRRFILETLVDVIRALHPFMPYVTEEIWREINKGKSLLMVEKWPV